MHRKTQEIKQEMPIVSRNKNLRSQWKSKKKAPSSPSSPRSGPRNPLQVPALCVEHNEMVFGCARIAEGGLLKHSPKLRVEPKMRFGCQNTSELCEEAKETSYCRRGQRNILLPSPWATLLLSPLSRPAEVGTT